MSATDTRSTDAAGRTAARPAASAAPAALAACLLCAPLLGGAQPTQPNEASAIEQVRELLHRDTMSAIEKIHYSRLEEAQALLRLRLETADLNTRTIALPADLRIASLSRGRVVVIWREEGDTISQRLRVGHSLKGWQVMQISKDEVLFEHPSGKERRLSRSR